MENHSNLVVPNNDAANNQDDPQPSAAFEQAEDHVQTLSTGELQRLRDYIQAEIDHRNQEMILQREEEEQRRRREEEEYERKFAAWKTKFLAYDRRKEEEWLEKHSESKIYGSSTDEDSEASEDGMEYEVEEVNTSDMYSDAAEDKARMERYHDRKMRGNFDFELANPKIYARTMREGESSSDSEEVQETETDEDGDGSDVDDVESTPSSDNTSPTSSESADKWFREEEGCDSDEDDY
ncbi:luc7-like protein 3 [Papaver somniferum]|uniref:luc7-like protein 3 n=1 Tax=Papaver somniferum TaxID=3469 RepID=UPI000E6FA7E9|nr:luc7-like protein 3 [Papaver somniferum]